ncbi:Chromatin assembly factor 1 subunit FSM [Taenia solium]|eukprot:TsM_000164700 transcript=TsM_000164700 gene=TsM_000164700
MHAPHCSATPTTALVFARSRTPTSQFIHRRYFGHYHVQSLVDLLSHFFHLQVGWRPLCKQSAPHAKPNTPLRSGPKEREKAEKQAERARLCGEKEQRRQERQERREQVERERQARRLQREEERARKEEVRARREEERKAKEEVRARREEERKAKEEERRKREAERTRGEEEKQRKMEKQRALLMGFLVQQKPENSTASAAGGGGGGRDGDCGASASPFMQFELKRDQRQSPICRVRSEALRRAKWQNVEDLRLSWQSGQSTIDGSRLGLVKFGQPNYLHELRTDRIKPLSFPPTWPIEMPDGGGVPLQNMVALRFNHGDSGNGGTVWIKAKLLQFFDTYHPAFYGTWRRRSYSIGPRRPFTKDCYQLDYEVDSDDEWGEEEPGENISQSDGEEEEEEADDDEDEDAKFLVPHGYLSDDEGVHDEDDLEGSISGIDDCSNSVETAEMKRLRQRLSLAEYEAAHSRSLHKLKPLLLGPVWARNPLEALRSTEVPPKATGYVSDDDKENCTPPSTSNGGKLGSTTWALPSKEEFQVMGTGLCTYRVHLWPGTVLPIVPQTDPTPDIPPGANKPSSTERFKKRFPTEAIPYLIRLVHKNALSRAKLQFEFRVFWLKRTWTGKGEAPSCCLSFKEYSQCSEAEATGTPNLLGGQHAADTKLQQQLGTSDSLPLSKTLTMNKISEIAVFEEGLWRVRPEVLKTHKEAALAPMGLPKADESVYAITDPGFVFPAWPYLTDIAVTTITKRKSLQPSAAVSQSPSAPPQPSSSSSPPPTSTSRSKMTKSTAVKKRTTLDSFFLSTPSPSAKRMKTSGETDDLLATEQGFAMPPLPDGLAAQPC